MPRLHTPRILPEKWKPKVCRGCGDNFRTREGRRDQAKYCSHECYVRHREKRPSSKVTSTKVWFPQCPQCERIHCSRVARKKYCSPECRYAHRLAALNELYWYTKASQAGSAGVPWRQALIHYLRQRDGDRCRICNNKRGPIRWDKTTGPRGEDPLGPSIDHVLPTSKGGTNHPDNLRLAHWRCNNKRKNNDNNTQLMIGAA